MGKIKIIAEVANAHQGDIKILTSLINKASQSGADAIKFQWFKYDRLATPDYEYYDAYKKLFIPESDWSQLIALAKQKNLEVWIDVCDSWGLELFRQLYNEIDGIKLPSTILQSDEILNGIAGFNKPILIGVGGWYFEEIDEILSKVRKILYQNENITLMHGFQGYPTKTEDTNLKRIIDLSKKYNLKVGFADHIDGSSPLAIDLPIYSFFTGAKIIEKHITLDRSKKGYDYYSSLEPKEFSQMVAKLRLAEKLMGDGEVNNSQRSYLKDALRTVANKKILKGEIITLDKVNFKRCQEKNALMPFTAKTILPQIAKSDIYTNSPITSNSFCKPKVTIVVICRLKSTRLLKKALLHVNGVPSIERCLLNCLSVPNVDNVVLATSYLPEDDPLENFTMEGKVKVIRDDPDNVAKRMLKAAKETGANIVLRVTGDCPAVSPEILGYLINEHLKSGVDYTSAKNAAVGTAADVITLEALSRLINHPAELTYTEYLSGYFWNNPKMFSVNLIELPKELQLPNSRLTLDETKDLEMLDALYKGLNIGREPLYFSKIKKYLSENPNIASINAGVSLKWRDEEHLVKEITKNTTLNVE
ncbi:N-acetylneuraminate synthase family protein [Cytobacillus firmus]|uniref:N-acetylneuraminate synthase family protein n=1 Tax=Cytobacillus firmus TaxID=1399 RepID=UPI0018CF7B52|nr:N-acetylneuraminate synthase family protein [Cytobacillus firmus]MBG9588625.1 spore coat protein [Cytobacillus firmus]